MSLNSKTDGIKCIGIDPGFGRLGYGVVKKTSHTLSLIDFGCIETPPHTDMALRIKTIYEEIREVADKWQPDIMSIEKLFFGRNTTTAGNVWQARGVILLLAAQLGIDYVEPKPNQIKLSVCGNGNADKAQVQKMVQRLLNLKDIPRPDDAADALAISITGFALHAYNSRIR